MYAEVVHALADHAGEKLYHQRQSLVGHLARSMLAGMYVGAAIVLILVVGGNLSIAAPHLVKLLMGVCFGGALTMVILAGSELFTGCNLVLPLAVMQRRVTMRELLANWSWTWLGNLLGSLLLVLLVVRSGVLDADQIRHFVLKVGRAKVSLSSEQMLWRGVLANWIVCLAVWMNAKMKSEPGRILMIWWCMFTFITCGFEHSVANMTTLALAMALGEGVTWVDAACNLGMVTLGNILGGAGLVATMYWIGSRSGRVRRPDGGVREGLSRDEKRRFETEASQ